MLKELLTLCKEKDTVVRIVYGTESHENNQYDILSLLKIYDKVKVIKYVTKEELLPKMNVLYLPEEHIYDQNDYYKDYFNKPGEYNYVFGHGVIKDIMSEAATHMENKKSNRKKVPIFNAGDLIRICKGQTFFGHYHINNNIDDKVFYVGSFSRWKFGEEGKKGYYELEYDTNKEKYKANYIENTMADTYNTISYGYDNKIFDSYDDMEATLNKVDDLINKDAFDHVRFIFNIPTEIENPEATINYIKERYKYNDQIKLEITHGYIEKKRQAKKEKIESENEKYNFIFDKSQALEDVISRFIEIEYNRSIPSLEVKKYLLEPLTELID
jgi:hypothetical protein